MRGEPSQPWRPTAAESRVNRINYAAMYMSVNRNFLDSLAIRMHAIEYVFFHMGLAFIYLLASISWAVVHAAPRSLAARLMCRVRICDWRVLVVQGKDLKAWVGCTVRSGGVWNATYPCF